MDHTSLDNTLRSVARQVRWQIALRGSARCVTLSVIALIIAVALDALFALPMMGLLAVQAAVSGLVGGALGFVLFQIWCARFDRQRTARMIEERLGFSQSDLINAVQFSAGDAGATSLALRDATILRGDRFASTLAPSRVIDKRPTHVAFGYALAALLVLGIAWMLMPSVFRMTLSRYLHPFADLPPFTLVNFHFDHPEQVYEGERADIRVTLTGSNLPEQAQIVFVDLNTVMRHENVSTHPMLRVQQKQDADRSKSAIDDPDTARTFLFPIPKARHIQSFYVNTPAGRSELRNIDVLPVPRFESVMVTYEPPAYTGWKTTSEHLTAQGIRALTGTKATITVKSSLPLRRGELDLVRKPRADETPDDPSRLRHRSELLPDAADPRSASITLTLTGSATFELSLIADNVQQSRSLEPLKGVIEVAVDAPPRVQIVEPVERQIIAPVGWKVPVVIEAEDDVKVTRIALHQRHGEAASIETQLALTPRSPSQVQANHAIDLGALNAKAGDVITFFATAYDNFPLKNGDVKSTGDDGGIESSIGQSTDTETYVIHVISMEDYQNHARSQYQMEEILAEIERFDGLLRKLDEERARLLAETEALQRRIAEQGGKPTPEDERRLAELNEKLQKFAEDQWKLAKELRDRSEQPNLYDFERAYARMLEEQANQLDRGAEDAARLQREHEFNKERQPGDPAEMQRHLNELAKQLKRDDERLDAAQAQAKAAQQDMALIEKADRIMSQAQRVSSLIEAQRDLADRLAPFKEKKELTPAEQIRAQRLAMEQQALKEDLKRTIEQLEEAGKAGESQLPQMAQSAQEIAGKLRELRIESDQDEAGKAATQGDGGKAHQFAESAAKKLESMLGQCEGMGEQAQGDFADAKFQLQKQSLGQGLQQLSQGRKLPQLGEGQPGSSGSQNPGQSGLSGTQGARGRFSVYGPRSSGQSGAQRRGGRDGTGRGAGVSASESQAAGAETLSPDSAVQRGNSAAPIPGVPVRYQDLAEQYFRRLAEEAK